MELKYIIPAIVLSSSFGFLLLLLIYWQTRVVDYETSSKGKIISNNFL